MQSFAVRRVGYALGAEITGLDLRKPLEPESAAALRQAFLEHCVLCFPGQNLEAEELMAFSGAFGVLDDNEGAPPTARHPDIDEVLVISNQPITIKGKPAQRSLPADKWHSDHTYLPDIPTATVLLAKEIPEIGGDTMFASMYAAYEALSPGFKAMIEPLALVHDVTLGPNFRNKSEAERQAMLEINPPAEHEIAKAHPETGRKALVLGQQRVRNVAGMTEEESQPLIDFLHEHATRYEFVYRHRWRPNDLVMWDNRCTMHFAVQDYDQAQLRWMIRCSVLPKREAGDRMAAAAG